MEKRGEIYTSLTYRSLAYTIQMEFIETSIFTRQITKLITDDGYKLLREHLIVAPEAGVIIEGSNGLRKIGWSTEYEGNRGGIRVIYYWHKPEEVFYLLLAYDESEDDDLTKKEIGVLSKIVKECLP